MEEWLEEKWLKILEEGIRKGKVLISTQLEGKPVINVSNAVNYLSKKGYPWEAEELGYIIDGADFDWFRIEEVGAWEIGTYEDFGNGKGITYNEFITK